MIPFPCRKRFMIDDPLTAENKNWETQTVQSNNELFINQLQLLWIKPRSQTINSKSLLYVACHRLMGDRGWWSGGGICLARGQFWGGFFNWGFLGGCSCMHCICSSSITKLNVVLPKKEKKSLLLVSIVNDRCNFWTH